MSEFKANGYVPKTANDLAAEHYERAKSGKNNPAFFAGATHVIRLEYQPLYNAYTPTRPELESVKAELDRGNKLLKEVLRNVGGLEDMPQILERDIMQYLNPTPPHKN